MKYKIAIVGLGGMGTWHLNKLQSQSELEVAGVWDIKEERRAHAQECGVFVYDSFEAVLVDTAVDIVLIATPNDSHKPLAIAAMRAGKHVICEKPVTISSQDLEEMIAVSEETGQLLTVHQNRRWDKDFLMIKEILREGRLGPVYRIESRVQGSRGIPGDWRQEPEKGGGMILDWGVHLLDQVLLLYPDAVVETVFATITNITNTEVDDGFTADLRLNNGVHLIVQVGTSNFITLPRWVVLGRDGTAIIEDWNRTARLVCACGKDEEDVVPIVTAAGITKTMAPRREDTIATYDLPQVTGDTWEFYRNVIACLNGEAECLVTLPQVSRVMRLMETILQSAKIE
jgi:scyllo-inositol 2-dehydrogenase (NADP+)